MYIIVLIILTNNEKKKTVRWRKHQFYFPLCFLP